jgi:uncharacterized membrane protein
VELALRIVHVAGAIVWTGGTIALVFVEVPPLQRLQGEQRAALLRELGRRWRPIGWSALGVAIASGIALADRDRVFAGASRGVDWVIAVKGAFVGLLVAGAYLHDYVLGPGLARQIRAGEPQRLRPLLVGIGRANLLLTCAIPVLGVVVSQLIRD